MIPSFRLALLFTLPLALALLMLVEEGMLWPMLGLDAGLVVLAGLDFLVSLKRLVTVRREAPEVMSLGRQNAVTLALRSISRRRLRVQVTLDLFDEAHSPDLPFTVQLGPRGNHRSKIAVEPRRRGAYHLGDHWVRYPSLLGLWLRQYRVRARHAVRVYPDLQQVRQFELLARQNRELSLVRASRLKGGESEFARLRDYTRDDEFRAIDWKATARRQKLTSREYQLESNQNIVFMLDAGRLMTAQVGGISQFDHALNATLMLSHVATRGGDQVGLVGFDATVRAFVHPSAGPGASAKLVRAAYDLHPRLVESDYDRAFAQVALRQRKRSLLILFTQVVDNSVARTLLKQTRALLKAHLPLIVLFRDTDVDALLERSAVGDVGRYQQGAAAELLRWRGSVIGDLKGAGALVLDVAPQRLTGSLINTYLQIKARHLL